MTTSEGRERQDAAGPAGEGGTGRPEGEDGGPVRDGGTGAGEGGRVGGVLDVTGLQRRLTAFAAARGWEPYHTPKNLVAALSVETAELVEIFQWLTPEQSARVMDEKESAHRVRDEVADVLAYLLQFCEVLGVDPLEALSDKIDRNEVRFPVT